MSSSEAGRPRTKLAAVCRWLSLLAAAPAAGTTILRATPADLPVHAVQLLSFVPWLTVPAAAALVLALPSGSRLVQLLAAAVLAVQVVWLFPANVPRPAGGPSGQPTARVVAMTINAEVGRAEAADIVDLVRSRHVNLLAVEEYTPELAARLSAAGLDALLPHRVSHARQRAAGSAIYSSSDIKETGAVPDTPFIMPVVLMDLGPAGNGATLQVVAVHSLAPVDDALPRWREDLRAIGRMDPGSGPLLLAGDFNATYDHREFRDVLSGGSSGRQLVDVAAAAGSRLLPTWPMQDYHLPGITLDHLVTSQDITASDYSVHRIRGTDHAAVLATLEIPAG